MRLYEITLPLRSNAGVPYSFVSWEDALLRFAGGHTRLPVASGAWLDDGKIYKEDVTCYRVACSEADFGRIVARAFAFFPDQLSIFTAEIGIATFHRNS